MRAFFVPSIALSAVAVAFARYRVGRRCHPADVVAKAVDLLVNERSRASRAGVVVLAELTRTDPTALGARVLIKDYISDAQELMRIERLLPAGPVKTLMLNAKRMLP